MSKVKEIRVREARAEVRAEEQEEMIIALKNKSTQPDVSKTSVKASDGSPVFQNIDEGKSPAMVVFAVPEEYYILLKKAEYLRTYDSTLIPVPTNESLKDEPGDLEITSEQLKDWINKVTVWTET